MAKRKALITYDVCSKHENIKPIVVTEQSDIAKNAVHGALKKLKTSIDTLLSSKKNY
jgi:hypothetical protein